MKFKEFYDEKHIFVESGDKWDSNMPGYAKRQQDAWDADKRAFKRAELDQELGHETNNYAVAIDGRTWKVFADRRQAENIARSLVAKGKKASVQVTGAAVSESEIAAEQGVAEAPLDPSGLHAAAKMVKDYIITAEVDGKVKHFKVRGMTGPTAAKERFMRHASMARVLDVKAVEEKGVAEGYTQSPEELKRIRQAWAEKYPNIDELIAKAEHEMKFHQNYEYASGRAYYDGEQAAKQLAYYKAIKKMIDDGKATGLEEEQGVAEGSLNEGQYEMMMRNGRVKKFIAKDDADAKRIAAGHGAKSVIKLRGGVPAGKVAEQGVAEGFHDDSPVTNAITRRIMMQRTDLLAKYGPGYVGQAIDDVADSVGDVEEIGSSDVSGWVKRVEWNLQNKLNQYDEPMDVGDDLDEAKTDDKIGGQYDPEEFDDMLNRIRKLAGQGELKTVWDPVKRVYKNVPVNQNGLDN